MSSVRGIRQLGRLAKSSLAEVFDQETPFGRLALVHTLQAAGTTLITISLAGSLFFSISPEAAKGKVLLYLLLTIAPFAVVGPALSPLLDRSRRSRRTCVAIANFGSALTCVAMARAIHELILFPEAFVVLVLGKLYLVARAALVPTVTPQGGDLATTNAKLAVLAALAGFVTLPLGVGLLHIGAPWVLCLGAAVFLAGAVAALRLPRPDSRRGRAHSPERVDATPARRHEVERERQRLGLPLYPHQVSAAIAAMSVARASVGFTEFFLAFALRRAHAATWWFGALLVASGIGSLIGSAAVPRLRRVLSERQILLGALGLIVIGACSAAMIGGRLAQVLLTLVVGVGPTAAKPALDSLVQHHYPPALLGRAFGRLETRLQLLWVLAALVGVLIPFALRVGDIVIALACLAGFGYYLAQRRRPSMRRLAPSERGGPTR